MSKLKINEKANDLRKKLEEKLKPEDKNLAVEVTNISVEYMQLIKQMEKKK